MTYNIDYLISALVFLCLISFHYVGQRWFTHQQSRRFLRFMALGLADAAFDLLTTVLIAEGGPALHSLTEVSLIIFYLLQAAVPMSLILYVQSLRQLSEAQYRRIAYVVRIPVLLLGLLILSNHWTRLFFTITPQGSYIHGPFYNVLYGYAILVVLLMAADSLLHFREYGIKNVSIIWEFLLIMAATVVIQGLFNDLLMTSFGLALGITILYLTISNPLSYTDNLTGLYDRNYLSTVLRPLLKHKKPIFLLQLSILNQRQINALWGNDMVNRFLKDTSRWLLHISRGECVFRIGDNLFLIICTSLKNYIHVRDKLIRFDEEMTAGGGDKIRAMTAVIGIPHGEDLEDNDDLLGYLDYLGQLLPAGRSGEVIQGDEETLRGYRYQQDIEKYLDTAIDQDLFSVVYQPIWSVKDQRFRTMETLSRLNHPTLGPVPPEVFLGIAEKHNRILTIAELQFRRVCLFVSSHRELLDKLDNIKFNLSPVELLNRSHMEKMMAMIGEYGLEPAVFQFEITETAATEYSEALNDMTAIFRERGISLCLDDFGSGYDNLNTVLKMPFSVIKMDRSLLNGIEKDANISLFYQSILALMKKMGYQVVAEGVETADELAMLTSWGVEFIQGYYFSKPVGGDTLLSLLAETGLPAVR